MSVSCAPTLTDSEKSRSNWATILLLAFRHCPLAISLHTAGAPLHDLLKRSGDQGIKFLAMHNLRFENQHGPCD